MGGVSYWDQGARKACIVQYRDCLRRSYDLWFSRLLNCNFLFGMKNVSSSSLHLSFGGGFSSAEELKNTVLYVPYWKDPFEKTLMLGEIEGGRRRG